jgi:Domain of unknown function (DUF4417)/ParB-like nuclease domain
MELKQINVNQIKTYENNPRDHSNLLDPLVEAITRYGFRVPIIMKHDGTLIDGHGRLKAAKRLGMYSIPALVLQEGEELTPDLEKAFRVSINELATKADWDQDKLTVELENLNLSFNTDEIAKLTGFDLDLVDDLLSDDEIQDQISAVGISRLTNDVEFPTTGRFDFPKLLDGCWYEGPTPTAWLGDATPPCHLYTFSTDSAQGLPWPRTVMGFYTADGKLDRLWRDTAGVVERLQQNPPAGLITPDFSVFHTNPLPQRLIAAYQSLWCGRFFQEAGFKIIVNVASCAKDIEGFLEVLPPNAPLSRQIQSSMQAADVLNERGVLDAIAEFKPAKFWCYAPEKNHKRFSKEIGKIANVSFITPRMWARKEKYGF